MILAAAIMAHPSRAAYAQRLARDLGVSVVWDPEPDGDRNPWRAARAAWSELLEDDQATHALVLQEDVLPCPDFLRHATSALAAKPSRITSFFLGHYPTPTARDALIAQARGASWVLGHPASWVPALALAIPLELVPSLVEFDDGTEPVADDEVYGRWTRLHGLPWYATIPSLVDHDDEAPSLMRDVYGRGERRAMITGEPGLVDWGLE